MTRGVPSARATAWRLRARRAGALLGLYAGMAAWGDALGFVGGLAWTGAVALAFSALMIRFTRAGFAFVAGGVALVTLLLPFALVLVLAVSLEGARIGPALAAWFLAGDPLAVVFERLLPTIAAIIAWPMLVRLLRPRAVGDALVSTR